MLTSEQLEHLVNVCAAVSALCACVAAAVAYVVDRFLDWCWQRWLDRRYQRMRAREEAEEIARNGPRYWDKQGASDAR